MPVVSLPYLYVFSHSSSSPSSGRRARRLRLESLEARHALSTLLDSGSDDCLTLEPALETNEVQVADDLQTTTETVSAPLEADAYFDSLGGTTTSTEDSPTSPPTSDPSTVELPPPASAPPVIFQFQGELNGSLLYLRGLVGDDQPLHLCTVEFGGALAGQSTSVLADGTFSYQALMPPPGTTILARAVDADGLYSEWFEVIIVM